jgi:DNA-directed RNA polymerase alpha subunit
MRVGDRTDYNLLRLKVGTDGTVAPHEALHQALETLDKLTESMIGLLPWNEVKVKEVEKEVKANTKEAKKEEEIDSKAILSALKDKDPKDIKVDEMGLSVRAVKALNSNGFRTLSGVLKISSETLQGMNQIGEKVFTEIKERVEVLGYSLKNKEK